MELGIHLSAATERMRRLQMLEEATGVIRHLFTGDRVAHDGRHFRVEDARLYSLPDEPVPTHLAASGTTAAAVAGRMADGLIVDSPVREAMLSPIVITDDVEPIVERIEDHQEAGATHVSLHQIGSEQETFLRGPARVLLERYGAVGSTREEEAL